MATSLGAGLVLREGMETVDASLVDTDLVGHSYFAENRSVLSDIFYIIKQGLPASQRAGLRQVPPRNGGIPYWTFRR